MYQDPVKSHKGPALYVLWGAVIAALIVSPYISYLYGYGWWTEGQFAFYALFMGMQTMGTFFHELGHTAFHWFYGSPALPSFDFTHGGGMTYSFGSQPLLFVLVYAGLGYLMFQARGHIKYLMLFAGIFLFHLATAFTSAGEIITLFMGHGSELLVGAFFLTRAWLNLAPRGAMERMLNAIIGYGIIFLNMILYWGLMTSDVHRQVYLRQKGGHGFGDFSRIQDLLGWDAINGVAAIAMLLALCALILPAFIYAFVKARPEPEPMDAAGYTKFDKSMLEKYKD